MFIDRRLLNIKFTVKGIVSGTSDIISPSIGDRYILNNASSDNNSIVEYDGTTWQVTTPPNKKQMEVLNLENMEVLEYNSTNGWVFVTALNSYIPVDNIIEDRVATSPSGETHQSGDHYLNTSDGKIYTFNGRNNQWVPAANVAPDGKYVCLYDCYIYTKSGNTYTHTDLTSNSLILNKADISLYTYSASVGIKKFVDERLVHDKITVTAGIVESGTIEPSTPIRENKLEDTMLFVDGILQRYNIDYYFSSDTYNNIRSIIWNTDEPLFEGSQIDLYYIA